MKILIRNKIIDAGKEKMFSDADKLATDIIETLEGYDEDTWGWAD
jgi:hypothetical protein